MKLLGYNFSVTKAVECPVEPMEEESLTIGQKLDSFIDSASHKASNAKKSAGSFASAVSRLRIVVKDQDPA